MSEKELTQDQNNQQEESTVETQNKTNAQEKPQTQIKRNDYEQIEKEKQQSENSLFAGVTVVSVGQGGATVGFQLETNLRKFPEIVNFIAVNTARDDLKQIQTKDERKILIGDGAGAGKNRKYAKSIFYGNNKEKYFEQIIKKNESILFGKHKIVLVVFTAGGGTGSSAPKFVAELTKYCATVQDEYAVGTDNNGKVITEPIDAYRPAVIGVCLVPDYKNDLDAGVDTLQNTLECMNEIDILVKNKVASFMLVQNKIKSNVNKDESIYSETNANVVKALKKFIKVLGTSNDGTILDTKDRFVALNVPGLIGFTDLNNNDNEYSFILPAHGAPVSTIAAELSYSSDEEKQEKQNKIADIIRNYNVGDITVGWNDVSLVNNNQDYPELRQKDILLIAGYSNLSNILNPLRDTLDRKIKAMQNKDISGKAFENISELSSNREKEKSKQLNISIDDLI